MANVNTDIVTNFVATPSVKNDSQQLHGVKRIAQGTIALAAGDLSAGDTVEFKTRQVSGGAKNAEGTSDVSYFLGYRIGA